MIKLFLCLLLSAPAFSFHIAVGSFTNRTGSTGQGISLFSLHGRLRSLITLGPKISGPNPGYLAVHPPLIYAANTDLGALTRISFRRRRPYVFANSALSGTETNAHVAVLPRRLAYGKKIVLMASFLGNVTSFTDKWGHLELVDTFTPNISFASGLINIQKQPRPHQVVPYKDGVLVPDLGSDLIWYLGVQDDGKMEVIDNIKLKPLDGPRHLVVHPKGYVYVICQLSNAIVLMKEECGGGKLAECERAEQFTGERGGAAIRLSPDGRFVYASIRIGEEGVIVGWEIGEGGEFVKSIGQWGSGGATPRDFDVTEKFVLVVNKGSDNLVVFDRDVETGVMGDKVFEKKVLTPVSVLAF